MTIHPTAIIHESAQIADSVEIGPYAIVGPHTVIAEGCRLDAHAVVKEYTRIGKNVLISSGAVLGGAPQDLGFKNEESWVEIGDNCLIRECVTVNRASGIGAVTRVGKGCMLMAYSHLGHNCQLGDEVILANAVQLGGHVEVGNYAFLGGGSVFHQHIRIGQLAIVSGGSASRQDIAPFGMYDARPVIPVGTNKIGMRRRGYDMESREIIRNAYKILFFSPTPYRLGLEEVEQKWGDRPYIQELVEFVRSSKRGLAKADLSGSAKMSDDRKETMESLV